MIHTILEYLVMTIMGIGMFVIVLGFVKACIRYFATEWKMTIRGTRTVPHLSLVRHDLGVYLLLGLEFIIAGDVIETILNPQLEHLYVLGGIVVIRIAISYFLGKELAELKETEKKAE